MRNPRTILFFIFLAALVRPTCMADESMDLQTRARHAIEAALPNLQRGATGSADQRECFTCHHQAMPVFALVAADKHGFAIDRQVLDRQLKHTYDHLKRGVEGYLKGQGQGGGVLTAGYALWALDETDRQSDEVTEAVAHFLSIDQKELPFWRHQGRRPPTSGSDFTATYVALRALSHFGTAEQKESAKQRIADITVWLENTQATDTEDHVFRLLCMRYLDIGSESHEQAVQHLIQLQQTDGGWGQTEAMSSDAYATATALYALQQESNLPADDPRVIRGLTWLLDSQLPDGTWHVTTRAEPFQTYFESGFPHGKDQFISMAATAWSTVVLADSLPNGTIDTGLTSKSISKPIVNERPIVSNGELDPNMIPFDEVIRAFVVKHHIPGASVAVTDHGRLVFARGYGLADMESGEPVQPTSLFRIASLSKPITAVGVLQLVEQDRLGLDDKVFSILDFDAEIQAAGDAFDVRIRDITIRQLLEHRGGWDREKSFDPMFQSVRFARELNIDAPAGPNAIIRAMLRQRLDFTPGEKYAYSNFGYCLLGRVIEKVTGQSYEAFIKESVLAPLGIHSMRLGYTRLEDRAPDEVRYYHPETGKSVFQADLGHDVPEVYGAWNLEAMDAHGGWIASAGDVARFVAAFDDPAHCPLLHPDTIAQMYARPGGVTEQGETDEDHAVYYSLGWQNRVLASKQINHWHTGSLPGTTAIMIRRHDGLNLVALLNTRVSPVTENLGLALDRILHQAADSVVDWSAIGDLLEVSRDAK